MISVGCRRAGRHGTLRFNTALQTILGYSFRSGPSLPTGLAGAGNWGKSLAFPQERSVRFGALPESTTTYLALRVDPLGRFLPLRVLQNHRQGPHTAEGQGTIVALLRSTYIKKGAAEPC